MKSATVGLLVLISFFLLSTAGVQAAATKTPIEVQLGPPTVLDPGKVWIDDEGILHIRGQILEAWTSLDIAGTIRVEFNSNQDLATGDGDFFGAFALTGTWRGLSGTFEGRFSGTFDGGLISGELVGHGSDGFEGMKIMATIGPTGLLEGIVLDPHGA